eukprot:531696_1
MTADSDYPQIVTWTYFTVYVTIFLGVSIYCVYKIRKDYKNYKNVQELQQNQLQQDWSKKGMFKTWYKSVWKKKKIYFQLIPHFFDQATDLGVILEYWRLRNDDVGINTMYLFGTSIFVIVFHRIISSIAIYRLTNNKKFVLLQIFDLLMIQSIWTNYQLDTDEPSNSQRYLQVLEAIFESSPQILISTAFLVKANTSQVNALVIISLITSFWSLSARVSGDDKQMFNKDWKGINFKLSNFKSFKCFDIINYKWFIRVILWRFMEISSRIVLLTLVWINVGGLFIFIMLGLEMLYLAIVCFGLGTVDMMGNIIYLMAASSNNKSKNWAIKMTRIFWVYRVISCWLLLIIVTIFALTQFKTDGDKVPDYNDRYSQTFENSTGFCLWIFCWIATPIWQWWGGVAIFDFGNLASVGRDVEQLVEDNKWLDVLELIKFGASFGTNAAAKALIGIYEAENNQYVSQCETISTICLQEIMKKKDNVLKVWKRAINDNSVKTVQFLWNEFKDDIDINEVDKKGRSVLFYAAAKVNVEMVEFIMNHCNANCNIIDKDGLSVIHFMFEGNHTKHEIFEYGARYRNVWQTKGSKVIEIIGILVCLIEDNNFDINVRDKQHNSIMDIAKQTEQRHEVKSYIMDKGLTFENTVNINTEERNTSDDNDEWEIDIRWMESNDTYGKHILYEELCCGFLREIKDSVLVNEEKFKKIVIKKCKECVIGSVIILRAFEKEMKEGAKLRILTQKEKQAPWKTKGLNNVHKIEKYYTYQSVWLFGCGAFVIFYYIATDIALLVINNRNDCNQALDDGNSEYVIFDINTFILCGTIIHLILAFGFCLHDSICFKNLPEPGNAAMWISFYASIPICCCFWLFFIAWSVIGFVLYSEMDRDTEENKQCSNAMLVWSIFKATETILTLCWTAYSCWMGTEDGHS